MKETKDVFVGQHTMYHLPYLHILLFPLPKNMFVHFVHKASLQNFPAYIILLANVERFNNYSCVSNKMFCTFCKSSSKTHEHAIVEEMFVLENV